MASPHVQPPVELLERMLTVRLHLDDADEANGALRALPGSHWLGRLSSGQIQDQRTRQSDVLCPVSVGDAMLMRPLLLSFALAKGNGQIVHQAEPPTSDFFMPLESVRQGESSVLDVQDAAVSKAGRAA